MGSHECRMCGLMSPSHRDNVIHMMGHLRGYLCMQCGACFSCAPDLISHTAECEEEPILLRRPCTPVEVDLVTSDDETDCETSTTASTDCCRGSYAIDGNMDVTVWGHSEISSDEAIDSPSTDKNVFIDEQFDELKSQGANTPILARAELMFEPSPSEDIHPSGCSALKAFVDAQAAGPARPAQGTEGPARPRHARTAPARPRHARTAPAAGLVTRPHSWPPRCKPKPTQVSGDKLIALSTIKSDKGGIVCCICGAKFDPFQRALVNWHVARHTNCSACGKRFKSPEELLVHMDACCELCKKCFSTKFSYNRHTVDSCPWRKSRNVTLDL